MNENYTISYESVNFENLNASSDIFYEDVANKNAIFSIEGFLIRLVTFKLIIALLKYCYYNERHNNTELWYEAIYKVLLAFEPIPLIAYIFLYLNIILSVTYYIVFVSDISEQLLPINMYNTKIILSAFVIFIIIFINMFILIIQIDQLFILYLSLSLAFLLMCINIYNIYYMVVSFNINIALFICVVIIILICIIKVMFSFKPSLVNSITIENIIHLIINLPVISYIGIAIMWYILCKCFSLFEIQILLGSIAFLY